MPDPNPAPDTTRPFWRTPRTILLFCAFFTMALNLRAHLTSLPTVIGDLQAGLGINQTAAGFLTTLPVLCFGVATPLAAWVLARVSIERAVFITLWGIVLGTCLRSAGGYSVAVAGSVVLGLALTVGNIVSLMVIARDFQAYRGFMTGMFVCAMNVGSMTTSALTPPLSAGLGWRTTLAGWSVMALISVGLWIGASRLPKNAPAESRPPIPAESSRATPSANIADGPAVSAPPPWRRPSAWLLAIAFIAHSFIYYGLTGWLPGYMIAVDGMDATRAGLVASSFQILGLVGCFGVPWLASGLRLSSATLFLTVAACWFIAPAGFLAAPGLWPLWTLFGGIGSGGGFVVVFTLVMERASTLDENRKISSFIQGIGYGTASVAPAAIGGINQIFDSWLFGFSLLAGMALVMAVCGFIACKRPA